MADCDSNFRSFEKSISLSAKDRKFLRSARNAIMKKIKLFFASSPSFPKVEFKPQGSFSMGTIIKPNNGEFDIDIGAYLIGYSNWQRDWPKPETASQWLYKALENHTSTKPINKRTCIRIVYKPLSGNKEVAYHVDIPIYIQYINGWGNKKTRIGINGDTQWSEKSDPTGLNNWFVEKCQGNLKDKDQLVRLVKYAKAWKDNKTDIKFPSGIALTVLLAENFSPHDRDDFAFYNTMRRAYNSLYGIFFISAIYKPVDPRNDLIDRLTSNQKRVFVELLGNLVDDGKLAINEKNTSKAIEFWKKHLGEKFQ
jgi:Second Messenger Oligonucleotide or Dinucleotide Synthetase domain